MDSDLVVKIEVLSALFGIFYFKKLKNSYWKWFVFYLIFISIIETCSEYYLSYFNVSNIYFFDYFVIPSEFLFLYWLYNKSLNKKKLVWSFCVIYLLSFIPHLFYESELKYLHSMSYTIGNLLMVILVFLEFNKQIQSDKILEYKSNPMFYINVGVMIFYLGTLPLFAFYDYLVVNSQLMLSYYYTFFLMANCIMYLLFTASFIWGKPNS